MKKVQNSQSKSLKRILAIALFLMVSTLTFAQQRVTGTVKDAQGEPLAGVSVIEVGTQNGVITDINGNYTLTVKNGASLTFSYVGFEPQTVKAKSTLNIGLVEDNELLSEVVVVGYGTMQRKDVSSSITTVKADDFNKGAFTDPAQLLQGKVPGLMITNTSDPTGAGSISLRGTSSFREGAMEPYYVVDGVPGVDLSLIAPDDIESIDVLRDATATAIYGSKAANGVIIVTTKKGNKDDKASVTYNGYVQASRARTLDMMDGEQLRQYAKDNDFQLPNDLGQNTNWQDEVLRTGIAHNHNISIVGGSGKSQYSASVNYFKNEGVIRQTNRERLNARTFVQTKTLNDKLELSLSVNGSITNNNHVLTGTDGASVINAMYYFSPLQPVTNEDGSWYDGTGVTSMNYNPVVMLNEDRRFFKNKFLQGVGKAAWTITKGLVWNLTLSLENNQYLFNGYDTTKSQLPSFASKHGVAERNSTESQKRQLETYVNFDKTFNKVHKLALMAGYSWEQGDNGDGFGLSAYNFYDDALSYYNLAMANSFNINDIHSFNLSSLRMISFYGRLNYSFDSRYIFQVTMRRDGSSAFGKNHRWGNFPSASVAWRIIDEKFMKNQKVFSDLKLRAGYGISGNSFGFDAFTAIRTLGTNGWFPYIDDSGSSNYHKFYWTRNENPDLKWEKTAMANIGLDFGFFNNRLTGTIEVYDKTTSDLIYSYPVSPNRYEFGYMDANVGEISNRGIELTLNAVPVRTKDFTWNTSFNISHNVNKVKKMSNDLYSTDYVNVGNPGIGGFSFNTVERIQEGYPVGQFFVWEWAGYNEAGNSLFNEYDEEGNLIGTTTNPQEKDRVAKGCAQPKVTFGWNNTFNYKNWSLTAFIQGVFGNKIFNATRAYFSSINMVTTGKNVLASVPSEQKFTDAAAQAPSDRYLENGSYLRLSNLQLAYNFGKIGNLFDNIQLYASANNLVTITKYKGIDPEVNLGGMSPGIDNRETRYPRTRSAMVGIKINFASSKAKKAEAAAPKYIETVVEKPVEVVKEVTKEVTKEVYTGNGVHVVCFAQGKYELTAEAKAELDNVKGSCDVVAYASPEGDVDANKTLSENRAKAVADYLTSKGVKVNKVAGEGAKNEASNRIAIVTVK